jgi:hypothetical protein
LKAKKYLIYAIASVVIVGFIILLFLTYGANILFRSELVQSRQYFETIISEKEPPMEWTILLWPKYKKQHVYVFYFWKVWFTMNGITKEDISHSYIKYPGFTTDGISRIIIEYKDGLPSIGCDMYKDSEGWHIFSHFNLNNCMYDPDINNDNVVDGKDVDYAIKYYKTNKGA